MKNIFAVVMTSLVCLGSPAFAAPKFTKATPEQVAQGKSLFTVNCASCHGPTGSGIPVHFPRLAGQHAEYTVNQLKTFRAGERANDSAQMMRMIAGKLSDNDIAAVADYIQGLK